MWVEIIGTVTDVFYEAEGLMTVGDEREAAGRISRQRHNLLPQIVDGIIVAELRFWEGAPIEGYAERK